MQSLYQENTKQQTHYLVMLLNQIDNEGCKNVNKETLETDLEVLIYMCRIFVMIATI